MTNSKNPVDARRTALAALIRERYIEPERSTRTYDSVEDLLFAKEPEHGCAPSRPNFNQFQYTFGFEDGTTARIGHIFKPTMVHIRKVMVQLHKHGLLEHVKDVEPEQFLVGDWKFNRYHIWSLIKSIGVSYNYKDGYYDFPWNPEDWQDTSNGAVKDEITQMAMVWCLMCADYSLNQGKRPKPFVPGIGNSYFQVVTKVAKFYCPFCGAECEQPDPNALDSVRAVRWLVWLRPHFKKYHKWNLNQAIRTLRQSKS